MTESGPTLDDSNSYVNAWGRRLTLDETAPQINMWGRTTPDSSPKDLTEADNPVESIKKTETELIEAMAVEFRRTEAVTSEHAHKIAENQAKYYLEKTIAKAGSADEYLDRLREHLNYLRKLDVRASALRETK